MAIIPDKPASLSDGEWDYVLARDRHRRRSAAWRLARDGRRMHAIPATVESVGSGLPEWPSALSKTEQ
jgi:hypothetical protein